LIVGQYPSRWIGEEDGWMPAFPGFFCSVG
jgi:hypothetical protein